MKQTILKRSAVILSILLMGFTAFAQNRPLSGKVVDQNGEPATIGIERIRTHNDDALTRASGDSWKVYYTGGIVNCHFYMTVTNNRVTSVYDDWILIVGGTYSDKSLTKTSTYGKLSFKAEAYSGIMASSCWLKGTVTGSGNTVNVTWQM